MRLCKLAIGYFKYAVIAVVDVTLIAFIEIFARGRGNDDVAGVHTLWFTFQPEKALVQNSLYPDSWRDVDDVNTML